MLEPNPYYRPPPRLRRIVLALIPTTQAGLLALSRARWTSLRAVRRKCGRARPRAPRRRYADQRPLYADDASRCAPTNDPHVRRAIAAAIDPAQIVRGGFGVLTAADSFLPPVFSWHDAAKHDE